MSIAQIQCFVKHYFQGNKIYVVLHKKVRFLSRLLGKIFFENTPPCAHIGCPCGICVGRARWDILFVRNGQKMVENENFFVWDLIGFFVDGA
jgi:hypothetical protein